MFAIGSDVIEDKTNGRRNFAGSSTLHYRAFPDNRNKLMDDDAPHRQPKGPTYSQVWLRIVPSQIQIRIVSTITQKRLKQKLCYGHAFSESEWRAQESLHRPTKIAGYMETSAMPQH
jgi:hypothetical protein